MIRVVSTPVAGAVPELAPRTATGANLPIDALQPTAVAERLRLPGALAITTGQQPGLFGGPMYVVHKALAARGLARCLEQQWGRPVVPVFWLAGDDHDWDEATSTAWWTQSGEVVEWRLQPREASAPQFPMYREPLPSDLDTARDRLADDLPRGAERDFTLDWIDRHWSAGATIHSAFASGMSELLGSLGIATIDATHPAFKRAQRPLIRHALESAREIGAALLADSRRDHRVAVDPSHTLVFLETDQGRDRLVIDDQGFRTRRGGQSFDRDGLLALLDSEPQRFSANVLLRPVVEAALLPTVAYVAGPGELRYLRDQASTVYPLLGVSPQPPLPRWGGVVIDHVSERLMSRLGVTVEQVIGDDGSLGRDIVRSDFPESIDTALDRLRQTIDEVADGLAGDGAGIDGVLPRAIESRRRRLQFVTSDLDALLARHHRKRDDVAWSQYRRLRNRVMPLDTPQERVIGVAAALGRWGENWLHSAAGAADQWAESVVAGVGQAVGGTG